MGFGACVNAAQTALIQGIDLFAEQQVRLVAAAEFASRYLLGAPQEAFLCSGHALSLDLVGTFEVAYARLAGGMGLPMPLTWQQIVKHVRPAASQDGIVSVYESLTHGLTGPA